MNWRRAKKGWWDNTTPDTPIRYPSSLLPKAIRLLLVTLLALVSLPTLMGASTLWIGLLGLLGLCTYFQINVKPMHWTRQGAIWSGWILAWLALVALFPADTSGALTPLAASSVLLVPATLWISRGRYMAGVSSLGAILITSFIQSRWGDYRLIMAGIAASLLLASLVAAPRLLSLWAEDRLAHPAPRPARHGTASRLIFLVLMSGIFWGALQFWHNKDYTYQSGPTDINQSGPTDDGGQTVVFSVSPKALGTSPTDKPMLIDRLSPQDHAQADQWLTQAYWRGGVFYRLNGSRWVRPTTPGGYNNTPRVSRTQFLSQKDRLIYEVTWAGRTSAIVSLEHPFSLFALGQGDNGATPFSQTLDGMEKLSLEDNTRWGRHTYIGVAAIQTPYVDPVGRELADEWAMGMQGVTDNPKTRETAQRLLKQHGRDGFITAWMAWLDAHSVYDLHRTAAGKHNHVADAFLFKNQLGHGTCVDFATSTVIALRSAGIPARYITGFQGAIWNSYTDSWIVANGQAHAWVEYYQASQRTWVRLDPTAAITRIIKANPPISAFELWRQTMTRSFLSRQRWALQEHKGGSHNLLSFVSEIPLPNLQVTGTIKAITLIAMSMGGLALGILIWRRRDTSKPRVDREHRRLKSTIESISNRWARQAAGNGKYSHESVLAWLKRVPMSEDFRGGAIDLAHATQAVWYGHEKITPALRQAWKVLDRNIMKKNGAKPKGKNTAG